MRRFTGRLLIGAVTAGLALAPAVAHAAAAGPGAPGIGDAYFPLDGNGGYDVAHYDLNIAYDAGKKHLGGVAKITATATSALSRFDLDLDGLTVRRIVVDGRKATWTRSGQELRVTPPKALAKGKKFVTVVAYDGRPTESNEDGLGESGWIPVDDGAIVAGQPHVAAHWFPVDDHPADKASYSLHVVVPNGIEVAANGVLKSKQRLGKVTRWNWEAKEPMASYLVTITNGNYDVTSRTVTGRPYVDFIDHDLFTPFAKPSSGKRFAYSQAANDSYKRLARVVDVPAAGATVSFTIARDTEPDWDYAFVEAHTPGKDNWTTLRDLNGHTKTATGNSCLDQWGGDHPFLAHYQTLANGGDSCSAKGTTGHWNAATGASKGYETWKVDLAAWKGKQVELSISYASDYAVQKGGVVVDDVNVSAGPGSTGFEADADPLDGWTTPAAPAGSPGNLNTWKAATADEVVTTGDNARASLQREPEILDFLAEHFGPYPFSAAGGIVTDYDPLGFALETQTRPVYANAFFGEVNTGVVVHENTHQWYGDSLALKRWQHIWLNEGFATYAEWLWSEHEGEATPSEIFDQYASIPADDDFWKLTIGDPGPVALFDGPVYDRGAMTLEALRRKIGDAPFASLLKRWAAKMKGGNVTTAQFVAMAEKVSGQQLDSFFKVWLFTGAKPAGIEPPATAARALGAVAPRAASLDRRYGTTVEHP